MGRAGDAAANQVLCDGDEVLIRLHRFNTLTGLHAGRHNWPVYYLVAVLLEGCLVPRGAELAAAPDIGHHIAAPSLQPHQTRHPEIPVES